MANPCRNEADTTYGKKFQGLDPTTTLRTNGNKTLGKWWGFGLTEHKQRGLRVSRDDREWYFISSIVYVAVMHVLNGLTISFVASVLRYAPETFELGIHVLTIELCDFGDFYP